MSSGSIEGCQGSRMSAIAFSSLGDNANKLRSLFLNQTGPVATAMASWIEEVERLAKVISVLA